MNGQKIRIGITIGDSNGVGSELILRTFEEPKMTDLFTPVVYGSGYVLDYYSKLLGINYSFAKKETAEDAHADKVNLIDCVEEKPEISVGMPTKASGEVAARALLRAADDLDAGLIDALVTCPISKKAIHSEEFPYMGHTEFLESRFKGEQGALMEFVAGELRMALATIHVPVVDVAGDLTEEIIVEKLNVLRRSLERDFLVSMPRIAVLALNPHAGEEGLLGKEEEEIIKPAMKRVNDERLCVFGPYPADGFWGMKQYAEFDAVLAMYHDQGLAPFKALAMNSGVNFTAGLSVVRTSPDHGTAYDIAGKGTADVESFRAAIYVAMDVCRNRFRYDEACANALKSTWHSEERDSRGHHESRHDSGAGGAAPDAH